MSWRPAPVSWTALRTSNVPRDAGARVIAVGTSEHMVKPTGWVVDMRHYIDEDTGDLPEVIPERVLSLAIFFGAIVTWVTDHLPEGDEHTNVPCRRSPGRRRCHGDNTSPRF